MQNKGKKFLSDLKLHSDYLKWQDDKDRYETWEEACESIIDGHKQQYADKLTELQPYLDSALESMKNKGVLASQRNLQFRYPQVKKSNARLYNCSSTHCVRNRVFQEVFFLGLNGCGVGISLLLPYVNNLSKIQKRTLGTKTYIIPDSIEGWSDSLGVLMSSYFVDNQPFPEYAGYEVKFDYSQIRPQGTKISGGFKAPGPNGLKFSLEKIENLLETWIEKEGNTIRPILAFDIFCHSADSVLSGSVRRSALNMLVDPNDEEMIHAKTGNWRAENPQRARSNNSVLFKRNHVTKEEFERIVHLNDGDSDIGFAFVNSWFENLNPCFEITKLPILTEEDLRTIEYEKIPEFIKENENNFGVAFCNLTEINAEKCLTKEKFLRYCIDASVIGTLQAGYTIFPYLGETTEKIVKREALLGVSITGWMNNPKLFNPELLKEGANLVKETNKKVASIININSAARTTTVKPSGTASIILGTASGIHPEHSERYFRIMQLNKQTDTAKWLKENMEFLLEESVWSATNNDYVVFVPVENPKEGLYKKDVKGIKHLELIKLVQENWVREGTNNDAGIYEDITHNVSCFTKDTKFYTKTGIKSFNDFKNGDYVEVINKQGEFSKSKIIYGGKQEIYKLTLTKKNQLKEIYTTKNHKWYVNYKWDRNFKSKELLLNTSELQPGMKIPLVIPDEFPEFNLEAFLHGCTFGDGTLHKNNNKCQIYLFGDKMNLLPYFEEFGCSGIDRGNHIRIYGLPSHWKQLPSSIDPSYIRSFISGWFNTDGYISSRGQTVSISNINYNNVCWIKNNACVGKIFPNFISTINLKEDNTYSKQDKFYYISFFKESLDRTFFKHPKKLQRWEEYIKNRKQKSKKWKITSVEKTSCMEDVYCIEEPNTNSFLLDDNILTHNCTVLIENKDEMVNYIFDNKDIFTAVSFLSDYGDKDFNQAPFTSVLTLEELIANYGTATVFASGLIVDGLHYFDNNLWLACDLLLDIEEKNPIIGTREQVMLRKYWLKRAKKFAKNYFKGDLHKMVYCLKDVHLFHKWDIINRQFREVDFSKILSKPVFKEIGEFGAVACSGGQCEIVSF
jgi:ribonucleoside-diphosphate reductase alpha chain